MNPPPTQNSEPMKHDFGIPETAVSAHSRGIDARGARREPTSSPSPSPWPSRIRESACGADEHPEAAFDFRLVRPLQRHCVAHAVPGPGFDICMASLETSPQTPRAPGAVQGPTAPSRSAR